MGVLIGKDLLDIHDSNGSMIQGFPRSECQDRNFHDECRDKLNNIDIPLDSTQWFFYRRYLYAKLCKHYGVSYDSAI